MPSAAVKREFFSPSPPPAAYAKRTYRMDDEEDEIDELAPNAPYGYGDEDNDGLNAPEAEVDAEGDTFYRIGEKMRVTQRTFNGKLLVDVREYYTKDDVDLPGKKGIALSSEQWRALHAGPTDALLAEEVNDEDGLALDDRLEQSAEGERFYRLGENGAGKMRRVSLREVKGREVVDIREFYFKDGEEAPGLKGVALHLDEWRLLLKVPVDFPALAPPAQTKPTVAKRVAPTASAGPGPSSAASSVASKVPADKKRRLSAALDEEASQIGLERFETNAEGEPFLRLGNNRRMTVRSFKGKPLVDLREFYTDPAGEERPGTKGLSLSAEQWALVRSSAHSVDSLLSDLLGGVEPPSAPVATAAAASRKAPASSAGSASRGRGGARGGAGGGRGGWGRGGKR